MRAGPALAVLALLLLGSPAEAKKFQYAKGPQPASDTTFSTAQTDIQPIVRRRGPRVPATNLQVVSLVATTAFDRALLAAPLDSGAHGEIALLEGLQSGFKGRNDGVT